MNRFIWLFFANDQDGYIGDTRWNPAQKDTPWIRIKWWVRNPAHNFTHHVIGFWHKDFESITVKKNEPGMSKYIRVYKGRRYPFWNYLHKSGWRFYFGWRTTGAFGIALRK